MTPSTSRLSATVQVLAAAARAAGDARAFTHQSLGALARHVGADLTTLSICDLRSGRRRVASEPVHALDKEDIAAFDRLFHTHPLVRFHADHPTGPSHRISDALTAAQFRRTPLYAEYYRRIGIGYAVAVPLYVDERRLVSFVLNRTLRDFGDRDMTTLEFLRAPLAALYRELQVVAQLRAAAARAADEQLPPPRGLAARLTPREREMVGWLAQGKSDAAIAALTATRLRTVQKHLQNAYVKLGVENRTAAALRLLSATRVAEAA